MASRSWLTEKGLVQCRRDREGIRTSHQNLRKRHDFAGRPRFEAGRPDVFVLNAIQNLDRVDWNFPNTGTKPGSVHTLHWFPGNFIPQIPAALIQILSGPDTL